MENLALIEWFTKEWKERKNRTANYNDIIALYTTMLTYYKELDEAQLSWFFVVKNDLQQHPEVTDKKYKLYILGLRKIGLDPFIGISQKE